MPIKDCNSFHEPGSFVCVKLLKFLEELRQRITPEFVGVGLVIYRNINDLPIYPLMENQPEELPCETNEEIMDMLLRCAIEESCYHDGFHLVNHKGSLTHLAQYFAPPIVMGLSAANLRGPFGGRYWAARFGSCMPGVLASGVLTNKYGPVVFFRGDVFAG